MNENDKVRTFDLEDCFVDLIKTSSFRVPYSKFDIFE
jgi:hypothetical protein